jgi:hypothetical protein
MLRRIYPPMLAVCKEWADLAASAATPTLEKASEISQAIVRLSNLIADEIVSSLAFILYPTDRLGCILMVGVLFLTVAF